ncbi:hypothetical protein ACIPD2_36885 [Streptomyces griseofuscus]|uniref:hypothetical protein n=1 Tax=Streptomyces griseofuscus TaxID=146922 RepID=UPI00382BA1E5
MPVTLLHPLVHDTSRPVPGTDRQPPADPGEPAVPRSPDQDVWSGRPRIPLQYERAVLAAAVIRERLRATTATAVRGKAYDVVAHQQAAMPEQLLAPESAAPAYDGREPEAGRGAAIDMTALRASRKSRADVESLDLTADRLRRHQGAFAKVGDDSRVRADRHTGQGEGTGPGALRSTAPRPLGAHHFRAPPTEWRRTGAYRVGALHRAGALPPGAVRRPAMRTRCASTRHSLRIASRVSAVSGCSGPG